MTKILRLDVVLDRTGKSTTRIYEEMKAGLFPQSVKLGPRQVGWVESDITDWLDARIAERNAAMLDASATPAAPMTPAETRN